MGPDILTSLAKAGALRPIDCHFARLIGELSGGESPELCLAAALASKHTGESHICVDLAAWAGKPFPHEGNVDGEALLCPELSPWVRILRASPLVGSPGEYRPLILDHAHRLYLYRYWHYEATLAARITEALAQGEAAFDRTVLQEGVERLFPAAVPAETDWQKTAALTAVGSRFTLIIGGPGTGKTFTVAKVLALLVEQAKGTPLRVALSAPTGKAAARLQEAISRSKQETDCSAAVREAIPEHASTVHRLLGTIPGSPYFRHHRENPLPFDVVVVDEASMVSLPLLSKLFAAVPREARLILLGDQDQLASVDPGAVLGDMCNTGASPEEETPLGPHDPLAQRPSGGSLRMREVIVALKKNFRFGSESGIGEVSRAIQGGDGRRALQLMRSPQYGDIAWAALPREGRLLGALAPKIIAGYRPYLRARSPEEALRSFEQFRVLCALREGPYGVATLNGLIERLLKEQKVIRPEGRWYAGRPLLITRNDYGVGLFNGDIGIVLPDPEDAGALRAFFLAPEGTVRQVPLLRLPEHETVYAMTVHKSQGSEFEDVLLVLPDQASPVLTRELVYTGITRARRKVTVWGVEEVLQTAVSRRIERSSGLREALWGERGWEARKRGSGGNSNG
jgi:exodeoxyribonuclease V alpha subunit